MKTDPHHNFLSVSQPISNIQFYLFEDLPTIPATQIFSSIQNGMCELDPGPPHASDEVDWKHGQDTLRGIEWSWHDLSVFTT